MKQQVELVQNTLKESGVVTKIYSFEDALENQGRLYVNYLLMVENLRLFIRASREGLWMFHLSSMNDFAKYSFAHDQMNYARSTPLYHAEMTKFEEHDKNIWSYLKENFSLGKSEVPFTCISCDHAVEQENKNLRVNSGITGLTQMPSTLSWFFLVASVISSLSDGHIKKYDIQHIGKRKTHYQFTGSYLKRLCDNVNEFKVEIDNYDATFMENNTVFNVVSKTVLPEYVADELLKLGTI